MMMLRFFVILNFILHPLIYVRGYMMSDVKQLLNDTLDDYNKYIRPVLNQSDTLTLKIGIAIAAIVEFDEVNQKLTCTAVMRMEWYDESMVWDPVDYGDLGEFRVSSKHFWTPKLVLTNSFESIKAIGDASFDVTVRHDGLIKMGPGEVFYATCDPDVTYFPWDRHACALGFVNWGENDDMVIEKASKKVDTGFYEENRGWNLDDTEVRVINDRTYYEVIFYLRRRPTFVLVNIVAPVILMSFLNLLSFLIPTETGERLSYSITMLLAISVFLTIVGDGLPKISNPMAIFSYYLLGVISMSCCIIFATLVSLNIYHKDEQEEINSFWKRLVIICNRRKNRSCVGSKKCDKQPMTNEKGNPNKIMPQFKKECTETPIEIFRDEISSRITWKESSACFDKLCFVVFLIIQALATTIFFTVLYASAN